MGNYLEITGGVTRTYYYAGATRIAMRDNGTLYSLFGDHLGSTSVTADASGALYNAQRYTPWGDVRDSTPNLARTTFAFTGQRQATTGGRRDWLMFYQTRYYDKCAPGRN